MPEITDLDWPRRTERLEVRPVDQADVETLWRIRRLPGVSRWMTWSDPGLAEYVERAQEPSWAAATLVVELDGAVIGDLMLRREDAWAQGEVVEQAVGVQAELGWCLNPSVQGHGYATEAVADLIAVAFEGLGLRRVTALCFAENDASWRLMERVGMRREAHNVQDALHSDGTWRDGYLYAMLADEWARG
ncbi:MAG TPA: GNAT family protein [Marmoricola sp.]|jgi:RimJ/RimL family protein N-acetyltransferase|nr:GNAT family protein [Marmoricola sp.]